MSFNQEHTKLPNGNIQIGDLIIGPAGLALIEEGKKYRANMAKIRLAEMLEEAIAKEGISQTELGNYMGVSRQAISKMLNGSTNFTVETLIRLEEILNADFISSALYKNDAMRMEYGVPYKATFPLTSAPQKNFLPVELMNNFAPNQSVFTSVEVKGSVDSSFNPSEYDQAA